MTELELENDKEREAKGLPDKCNSLEEGRGKPKGSMDAIILHCTQYLRKKELAKQNKTWILCFFI